jgi:hypothetical protein
LRPRLAARSRHGAAALSRTAPWRKGGDIVTTLEIYDRRGGILLRGVYDKSAKEIIELLATQLDDEMLAQASLVLIVVGERESAQ